MNDTTGSYERRSPRRRNHRGNNDLRVAVARGEGSTSNAISAVSSLNSVDGHDQGEKPHYRKRKRSTRAKAPNEEHLYTPWLDLLPVRQYDSVEQRLVKFYSLPRKS